MTTFEFNLPKKDRDGADAIFKVNRFLLSLLEKRMREQGMTRKKLADILEIDKSTISKVLRGNQNVTARTIGEICGALEFDFDLIERDLHRSNSSNAQVEILQLSGLNASRRTGSGHKFASYSTMETEAVTE